MRRHTSLIRLACVLAVFACACNRAPVSAGSEADAYAAVLAALGGAVEGEVVRVQSHAILVRGVASAPGDKVEHFLPDASAAIADAVAAASGNWQLCEDLGADCLTGDSGNVVALSELARRGEEADVWATYAQVHLPTRPTSWEIRYYKVSLRLSDGRWNAAPPVLLGAEP